ncbi:hypothetical protein LX97_02011 [Nonlabens dokdonensis]|jgi:hypothetical protein|uniref:Lipoprotein n=1 Tax=Nonlabens dokdonensis TaxID=328515 RepID=A0ABX5PWV1_9FLAO|nr:hypothetical protein [Nonlabens dokdonensis]PZX39657.1 hypothetical protein LX97_02011 [Nonlabens dokdonensis]
MRNVYQKISVLSIVLVLLVSCASIPASTSTLSKEVIKEANGMHELNLALIDQLYAERSQRINDFITYRYTPALLSNYEKLLPDSVDYKEELPNILQSIIPVINKKRDSMQSVLNVEKQGLVKQLNANFSTYTNSTAALQGLIDSAVKLKESESNALTALESLTGVSPGTVTNIDARLEKLLSQSGNTIDQLLQLTNRLKN